MSAHTLVAVGVGADGKIAQHAGRTLTWTVYAATPGAEPVVVWTIALTKQSCLHEWHVSPQPERHPLHAVDVAISGSAGDGVIRRLAERDTVLVTTRETDPLAAVTGHLAGTLPPGLPHDEHTCGGEGHQHDAA